MKLYIVRHGETDWNKARKIQGQSDIPLNAFGRHLARETAKGLADVHFDLCFTSPLSRAKETARIILEGRDVPIIEDPRIEEMSFGVYEGKCCSSEGWELPEEFRRFFDGPEIPPMRTSRSLSPHTERPWQDCSVTSEGPLFPGTGARESTRTVRSRKWPVKTGNITFCLKTGCTTRTR